jgi:hypothetical protein
MNRRNFLKVATTVAVTGAVAGSLFLGVEDEYDRFLESLDERVKTILKRDGTTLREIQIDPIEEIDGERFRFVQLWVREWKQPLTWYQPCSGKEKPVHPSMFLERELRFDNKPRTCAELSN